MTKLQETPAKASIDTERRLQQKTQELNTEIKDLKQNLNTAQEIFKQDLSYYTSQLQQCLHDNS